MTRTTTPNSSSPTCELSGSRNTSRKTQRTEDPRLTDGRTTRHAGYDVSQRIRKRVEEPFGWVKTVVRPQASPYRKDRNPAWFKMTTAVYDLIRITSLDAATA